MAKYNGSGILLYADGVEIAAQKGFNLSANVALFDTTTKQSAGWAEHEKGLRSVDISFEALQSTTGLSAVGLFDYISGRTSLTAIITGLASSIFMEVDCSNISINAPTEEAVGLSGSFKAKGRIYRFGSSENLISDVTAGGYSYDNCVATLDAFEDVDQSLGDANVNTNTFSVADGDEITLVMFLNSAGANPKADIFDSGPNTSITDGEYQIVPGFNIHKFTITGIITAYLKFYTSGEAHWNTGPVYLFKTN